MIFLVIRGGLTTDERKIRLLPLVPETNKPLTEIKKNREMKCSSQSVTILYLLLVQDKGLHNSYSISGEFLCPAKEEINQCFRKQKGK